MILRRIPERIFACLFLALLCFSYMKQYAMISVVDISEVVDINEAEKICTL